MMNWRALNRVPLLSAMTIAMGFSTPNIGLAHEEDGRVAIELESPAEISAGAVVVQFQLVDTKDNKVLTP